MSDCVKREVRELGVDRGDLWSRHHVSQGFSAPHVVPRWEGPQGSPGCLPLGDLEPGSPVSHVGKG